MSDSPVRLVSWDNLPKEELKPGLSRNWVNGEKGMLAQIYFEKGVTVPKHSHENEQFAYVLEGALLFRIGDDQTEEVVVRAGEVLHIPSNVLHSAEALEDTVDLDVFVPPREDWLSGDDDYLRG
ncbi:MAG: cupin domain-containing protein [Gemmatimonadetes bacterium]|jgi:quercetin dioxygenase-like cupin family protein|nr:cupin domain-containing protein [Gemmatimonadota bacterium]